MSATILSATPSINFCSPCQQAGIALKRYQFNELPEDKLRWILTQLNILDIDGNPTVNERSHPLPAWSRNVWLHYFSLLTDKVNVVNKRHDTLTSVRLAELLIYLKKNAPPNTRTVTDDIVVIGGILHRVHLLGGYYEDALQVIGAWNCDIEKLLRAMVQTQLEQSMCDHDVRFYASNSNSGSRHVLVDVLKNFLQMEKGYAIYKDIDPFINPSTKTIDENSDAFFIISYLFHNVLKNYSSKVDLDIITKLTREYLFDNLAVSIDGMLDFIAQRLNDNAHLDENTIEEIITQFPPEVLTCQPFGIAHTNPWKAIFSRLIKMIYIDDPETVNKNGWPVYLAKAIRGQRTNDWQAVKMLLRKSIAYQVNRRDSISAPMTAKYLAHELFKAVKNHAEADNLAAMFCASFMACHQILHCEDLAAGISNTELANLTWQKIIEFSFRTRTPQFMHSFPGMLLKAMDGNYLPFYVLDAFVQLELFATVSFRERENAAWDKNPAFTEDFGVAAYRLNVGLNEEYSLCIEVDPCRSMSQLLNFFNSKAQVESGLDIFADLIYANGINEEVELSSSQLKYYISCFNISFSDLAKQCIEGVKHHNKALSAYSYQLLLACYKISLDNSLIIELLEGFYKTLAFFEGKNEIKSALIYSLANVLQMRSDPIWNTFDHLLGRSHCSAQEMAIISLARCKHENLNHLIERGWLGKRFNLSAQQHEEFGDQFFGNLLANDWEKAYNLFTHIYKQKNHSLDANYRKIIALLNSCPQHRHESSFNLLLRLLAHVPSDKVTAMVKQTVEQQNSIEGCKLLLKIFTLFLEADSKYHTVAIEAALYCFEGQMKQLEARKNNFNEHFVVDLINVVFKYCLHSNKLQFETVLKCNTMVYFQLFLSKNSHLEKMKSLQVKGIKIFHDEIISLDLQNHVVDGNVYNYYVVILQMINRFIPQYKQSYEVKILILLLTKAILKNEKLDKEILESMSRCIQDLLAVKANFPIIDPFSSIVKKLTQRYIAHRSYSQAHHWLKYLAKKHPLELAEWLQRKYKYFAKQITTGGTPEEHGKEKEDFDFFIFDLLSYCNKRRLIPQSSFVKLQRGLLQIFQKQQKPLYALRAAMEYILTVKKDEKIVAVDVNKLIINSLQCDCGIKDIFSALTLMHTSENLNLELWKRLLAKAQNLAIDEETADAFLYCLIKLTDGTAFENPVYQKKCWSSILAVPLSVEVYEVLLASNSCFFKIFQPDIIPENCLEAAEVYWKVGINCLKQLNKLTLEQSDSTLIHLKATLLKLLIRLRDKIENILQSLNIIETHAIVTKELVDCVRYYYLDFENRLLNQLFQINCSVDIHFLIMDIFNNQFIATYEDKFTFKDKKICDQFNEEHFYRLALHIFKNTKDLDKVDFKSIKNTLNMLSNKFLLISDRITKYKQLQLIETMLVRPSKQTALLSCKHLGRLLQKHESFTNKEQLIIKKTFSSLISYSKKENRESFFVFDCFENCIALGKKYIDASELEDLKNRQALFSRTFLEHTNELMRKALRLVISLFSMYIFITNVFATNQESR